MNSYIPMWQPLRNLGILLMTVGCVSFAEEGEDMRVDPVERLWQAVAAEDYDAYIASREVVLSLPKEDFTAVVADLRQLDNWRAEFVADGLDLRRSDPDFAAGFNEGLLAVVANRLYDAGGNLRYSLGGESWFTGIQLHGEARKKTCVLGREMTVIPIPLPPSDEKKTEHDSDTLRRELFRNCMLTGVVGGAREFSQPYITMMVASPPSWHPRRKWFSTLLSQYRGAQRRLAQGQGDQYKLSYFQALIKSVNKMVPDFLEQYRTQEQWDEADVLEMIRLLYELDDEIGGPALEELRRDENAASVFERYAEDLRNHKERREARQRRMIGARQQAAEQAVQESKENGGDHEGHDASAGSDSDQK